MTMNKKIMKASHKKVVIAIEEGEKRAVDRLIADYPHLHANLFYEVLGIHFSGLVNEGETKQECRPRLEIAKNLLDRIEELSMGQWKVSRDRINRGPLKYLYIEVSLKEEFLRKMGLVPSPRNTFRVVEAKVPGETVIKIHLGCHECLKAFGIYAAQLLSGATGGIYGRPILMINGSQIRTKSSP